eukprot:1157706-Pelagomonas_calceolata.AAC.8
MPSVPVPVPEPVLVQGTVGRGKKRRAFRLGEVPHLLQMTPSDQLIYYNNFHNPKTISNEERRGRGSHLQEPASSAYALNQEEI